MEQILRNQTSSASVESTADMQPKLKDMHYIDGIKGHGVYIYITTVLSMFSSRKTGENCRSANPKEKESQ